MRLVLNQHFLAASLLVVGGVLRCCCVEADTAADPQSGTLAKEVQTHGWIAYSAVTARGDWDLFLMRPDGTKRRDISNTAEFSEVGPRFSPDGRRLLYRRLASTVKFNHDNWGALGALVLAKSDGSNPEVLGNNGELLWASWSPDGRQIATLKKTGIEFVDIASRSVVRQMDRKGIYQQLFWSPDGEWLTGPANAYGAQWTVVRMNAHSGEVNAVNTYQNCTPDWFPDSKRIIFSSRPANQSDDGSAPASAKKEAEYGWTQLWMANGDGSGKQLVYAEEGRHVYGGEVSPDGRYVLFTSTSKDGGDGNEAGATIYLMSLRDAPIIRGKNPALRHLYPKANDGPVLTLAPGWEPHWTLTEVEPR